MIDTRNGPDRTGAEPSSSTNITGLVSGIVTDLQELTAQQLALFREEISEDLRKARDVSIAFAAGLAVFLIGGILLDITFAQLLALTPLPLWACYGIIAIATLVAGACLVYAGKKKLETLSPVPKQSVRALKENIQCLTNPK